MAAQYAQQQSVSGAATYEYFHPPPYAQQAVYQQPSAQWAPSQLQHPASSPASWAEFPAPPPGHRSSVVDMSFAHSHTASPVMGERQWSRRFSEGAQQRPPSGARPEVASAQQDWRWGQPSASASSSDWQQQQQQAGQQAMLPPPLPPSTFSANVSPILAQQPPPGPSQPQQPFYRAPPSTSTHVYGRSPPPAPLATHSPPTPNLGHPYGTVHQLPNPNSPPYTQYQQQASLAGPARSPPMGSSSAANGPKPRGRKPKNYVKSAEEERVEREEYLERNRLAALKSRQRKKQKMGNLEAQAQEYSHHNDSLQKYALTLHSEVLHLRSILNQLDGQSFPDVEGYLQREAQGGGIPTILRIAGPVLERDYQDVGRV